jgi:hypothetical protein
MAFADPQSINNGTAVSLPRTGFGPNSGTFTSADGTITLTVSHTNGKRKRSIVRVDYNKIAADPFLAGQNVKVSMSTYVLVDIPSQGYSPSEIVANVAALFTLLTASTNAKLTQFVGGEN